MDLSGNMTRQIEQDMPVQNDESHIVNVGRLVEDMELKMRNLLRKSRCYCRVWPSMRTDMALEEVYFGKAKDIVGDLRSTTFLDPLCAKAIADFLQVYSL